VSPSEPPIYTSRSTAKSLWQEYRIYPDRLELDTHFGLLTVPLDQIERCDVRESDVAGLLHGDLQLRNFRPALKLDWANLLEHVVIDRDEGWLRRILLTPDDCHAFKQALDQALAHQQKNPDRMPTE
jgi:hypothetical protein